eukprot:Hpha_TRINITY_DN15810_c2_g5::TRINITY_DN15810_c2_g5_i1::g.191357::m.191357/K14457/MOGAT2, MGAT2; 2-acylglycerol O-acyltransferase 2
MLEIPAWCLLGAYILLLAFAYGLLVFMEKAAALRGSHRKPLPAWVDKGLRMFFLFCYTAPLLMLSPTFGTIIVLAYLPYYLDGSEKLSSALEGRLGREGKYLRNWIVWRWFAKRWNLKLHREAELPKDQQYIIGMHPHGVLPFGGMINMVSEATDSDPLPGIKIRTLAASFCFYVPLYRDLILSGGVIDAARYNAQKALKSSFSILLYPGGATEALYAGPGKNIVVIRKRRGFVKLALETGASLVPAYTFGENDGFSVINDEGMPSWLNKARNKWQAIFGFSLPLLTTPIPRKCNMDTVVGAPIPVERVEQPSDEQVQALLDKYIDALTTLYSKNADRFPQTKGKKLEVL